MKYNNLSLKVSADINNKAGEISVDNFLVKSSLLNGKGSVIANLARTIPVIDMNFDLESFDLANGNLPLVR